MSCRPDAEPAERAGEWRDDDYACRKRPDRPDGRQTVLADAGRPRHWHDDRDGAGAGRAGRLRRPLSRQCHAAAADAPRLPRSQYLRARADRRQPRFRHQLPRGRSGACRRCLLSPPRQHGTPLRGRTLGDDRNRRACRRRCTRCLRLRGRGHGRARDGGHRDRPRRRLGGRLRPVTARLLQGKVYAMIAVEDFKLGMRRLAAGVSIITTLKDEVPYGLVVTSASSLTSDPPTLLVCINKSASCHAAISEAGVFCVNVLSRSDAHLAALFRNPERRGERFSDRSWKRLQTGAPVLPSAIVAFDCTVDKIVPYQSHTIFIGEINGVLFNDEMCEPLVYLDGSYRRLAPAAELRCPPSDAKPGHGHSQTPETIEPAPGTREPHHGPA